MSVSWWDKMWSIVEGCTRVDDGCRNCSAEEMFSRSPVRLPVLGDDLRWNHVVKTHSLNHLPSLYDRSYHVFVAGMGDLFHSSVKDSFIDETFNTMTAERRHRYYILTKRTQRLVEYCFDRNIPDHIMLGCSISDQKTALKHVPNLVKLAGKASLWVNCEPLLGPIDLSTWLTNLSFVAGGAEEGPNKRHFDISWLRYIQMQCKNAGVPFFANREELPYTNNQRLPLPKEIQWES